MKIYKYPLGGPITSIDMPRGAEIIHVGDDPSGHVCVWARFASDNEAITEKRVVRIVGTGDEHGADLRYIGTFVQGPFVWHAFEAEV